MNSIDIDAFAGIHNVSDVRKLPQGKLSDAVNVDFDDTGTVQKRNGYALAKALADITASYSTPDQRGYVVAGGKLYSVDAALNLTDLGSSTATRFCSAGQYVVTNDAKRVRFNDVISMDLPAPALPPTLTDLSGSLPEAQYSFLVTHYDPDTGLESGTSPVVTVNASADSGYRITPHSIPSGITARVYATDGNGTTYLLAGECTTGGYVDFAAVAQLGRNLPPQNLGAVGWPITGTIVEFHEAKLCVTHPMGNAQTALFFSKPFNWHLFDLWKDNLIIEGNVVDMASTAQGLLICCDDAIYLYAQGVLQTLSSNYGAVSGRPIARRADGSVLINTARGICAFPPFSNITEKDVSLSQGTACAAVVVEQNGMEQLRVLIDGNGAAYNQAF